MATDGCISAMEIESLTTIVQRKDEDDAMYGFPGRYDLCTDLSHTEQVVIITDSKYYFESVSRSWLCTSDARVASRVYTTPWFGLIML